MEFMNEKTAGGPLAKELQKLIQKADNGKVNCAKSCIEELKHILKGGLK